jgi:hypothetical protein
MLLLGSTPLKAQSKKEVLAAMQASNDSLINTMRLEQEQADKEINNLRQEITIQQTNIQLNRGILNNLMKDEEALNLRMETIADSVALFQHDERALEVLKYLANKRLDYHHEDERFKHLKQVVIASGFHTSNNRPDLMYTLLYDQNYPDIVNANQHFYYYADQNRLLELEFKQPLELLHYIEVHRIGPQDGYGTVVLQSPGNPRTRKVDAAFRIQGDQIVLDDKYMPAIRQANVELMIQLGEY